MGLTLNDMNKIIYRKWRLEGLTHEQCLLQVPKKYRERFIEDINSSFCKAHFGVKTKTFIIVNLMVFISVIIFCLFIINGD